MVYQANSHQATLAKIFSFKKQFSLHAEDQIVSILPLLPFQLHKQLQSEAVYKHLFALQIQASQKLSLLLSISL